MGCVDCFYDTGVRRVSSLIAGAAFSLFLAGCIHQTPVGVPPQGQEAKPAFPQAPAEPQPLSEAVREVPPPQAASARVISVTSRNWEFAPSVISVKKGENVTLKLQGESGVHGFTVPDLGINVPVQPGETVEVKLPTDTAGVFSGFCSIPCGKGHLDMKVKVVVGE